MPPTQMLEMPDGEIVHYDVVIDGNVITVSLPDYPPYTSSTNYYKSYKSETIEKLVKDLYALAQEE